MVVDIAYTLKADRVYVPIEKNHWDVGHVPFATNKDGYFEARAKILPSTVKTESLLLG